MVLPMSARRTTRPNPDTVALRQEFSAALRLAERTRRVEAMRSGVRLRPVTIPSGKAYRRKGKYGVQD